MEGAEITEQRRATCMDHGLRHRPGCGPQDLFMSGLL